MTKFTDNAGNDWNVEFKTTTLRDVREDTGFAFGTCLNDDMKPLNDMLNDFEQLPYVLFSVLKKQVQERGLTQETFVNNVAGDAIEGAQRAIWEAFAFFCPPRERQMMERIREATDTLTEKQMEQVDKMMQTFIDKQLSSEQSSELSQDLIASEN